MNSFNTIATLLLIFIGLHSGGLAQSKITTYAGVDPLPVNGAQAVTQPIDRPASVISDAAGGFYFASQHRIYRVTVDGTLTAIAGTGTEGFGGDGGPALSAQFAYPSHLALDAAGNLFIPDTNNHRIRKVSPAGTISTVAGNGEFGFSGDGGLASAAQFRYPRGVAVDSAGNLFIADTGNARIRKVTPAGIISTVAGTGESGLGGDGGPASAAQLSGEANRVTVDSFGNLFIADCQRVRKVTPAGVISRVAGTAGCNYDDDRFNGDGGPAISAALGYATDVALDAKGNLFIADSVNLRVRMVAADGVIRTVAGVGTPGSGGDGGPATAAFLLEPFAVAVDAAGNLFIADSLNGRIRRVTSDGVIRTVAGVGPQRFSGDGSPAVSAQLNYPRGVAVDETGNLFIADTWNHRIRKVNPAGVISTVAGSGARGSGGDGGPASSAHLSEPSAIALDGNGNLFIADSFNSRIRMITPAGVITTVAGTGTWGFSGDGGPATSAELSEPQGIEVDKAGNLFIADTGNSRIRKVTPTGIVSTVAGTGDFGFSGDGGPATSAQLSAPRGLALDGSGNLFIADSANSRIRMITPAGVISTVAGTTFADFSSDGPHDVEVDRAGTLFFANFNDHRIRKVTSAGVISTVAGTGRPGFGGDSGPAVFAQLNRPTSVAVDAEGNLFIADSLNHRIRKVTPSLTGNPGEPVVISAVYPRSGPTLGGSRIRVLGRNFETGSIVRLGGVPVTALTFKSADEFVCLTPPLTAGTYSLEVTQPDGTTTGVTNAFTYVQLTKVAPSTPAASQPPIWRVPFVVDSPEVRTNLGINNLGSLTATVRISLVDHHGLLIAQTSTTVPPFGMQQINHIARFLESASAVTGREGYLILESNQDIRAWASQIDNASADPSFVLARSDAASRVLLPSSVSNDRFSTSLTVINTSATDGQVSLRLRDGAGALLASLSNQPIESYGYLYFQDIHKAAGLSKTFGPIEVEAHGGIHVIATAHIVSNERTGAYLEAVDVSTTGRNLVLYSAENADFRTNLGISNLGTVTANVTVSLVDKNGVPLGSLTTTVPAAGMTQINRVNLALGFASPGVSLEGTLRLESDQDIVAWTSQIDNLTQDSSFVVGKNVHSAKQLIPSATNVSGFKSSLIVANLDAAPTTVELKLRDVDGNLKASTVEIIPGNGLLSSADIMSQLGITGRYGPLEIVSLEGKPFLALSTVSSSQRTSGMFEGIP